MPANDPTKKKETTYTKFKNEVKYQDESDWAASCAWCCICCNGSNGGMFQFDAPADAAEKLPAILISPGFSHVNIERV